MEVLRQHNYKPTAKHNIFITMYLRIQYYYLLTVYNSKNKILPAKHIVGEYHVGESYRRQYIPAAKCPTPTRNVLTQLTVNLVMITAT